MKANLILTASLAAALLSACAKMDVYPLPDSSLLGNPRSKRMARVITHYHSPYSYDACDKAGLSGGVPNASCLGDLRAALCTNHVDYLFLTDHPDAMRDYEMDALLLPNGSDQLVMGPASVNYVNRMSGCSDSFVPSLMVGFEHRLLALGMTQHLDPVISVRSALYDAETLAVRNQLLTTSDAVVMIPHTESRSVSLIQSLQPDGIEIYNLHANLDPKIRKTNLGMRPFEHMAKVLAYLVDPYGDLRADYMFLQFVEVANIYFTTWDSLIAGGLKVAGFGGTDSHENVFPQKASDGERLDSHRRLTRFMSNHLVVSDLGVNTVKAALKAGRGWLVFEGFGSPVGMDLSATVGATTVGAGESISIGGGATIVVRAPSIYPDSHYGSDAALMKIELKRVNGDGSETVVASSLGTDITYQASTTGAYRAEIWIVPRHLRPLLGPFGSLADKPYRWIITNHVYIDP